MKNSKSSGKKMFNIFHSDWMKEEPFKEIIADKLTAINNHTCPHCKNERVSKTEKLCWLCGGEL